MIFEDSDHIETKIINIFVAEMSSGNFTWRHCCVAMSALIPVFVVFT